MGALSVEDKWTEVYAGIYKAECQVCSKHDHGWFWILNGSHDNGTKCDRCYKTHSVDGKNYQAYTVYDEDLESFSTLEESDIGRQYIMMNGAIIFV